MFKYFSGEFPVHRSTYTCHFQTTVLDPHFQSNPNANGVINFKTHLNFIRIVGLKQKWVPENLVTQYVLVVGILMGVRIECYACLLSL